jgi:hypothetical protein
VSYTLFANHAVRGFGDIQSPAAPASSSADSVVPANQNTLLMVGIGALVLGGLYLLLTSSSMTPNRRSPGRETMVSVENNISPQHIPFWRKIKRQFTGTPHERYEKFLEYIETDQGQREEIEYMSRRGERLATQDINKLKRQWKEQEKAERAKERADARLRRAYYKAESKARYCTRICGGGCDSERAPILKSYTPPELPF